jgi:prepilin-type N-terminal cleavage/methylation domain-containing protein
MARARIGSQSGFTLVEVMVAITLLLVGVLGTMTLIDGANAVTSQTKAREGATALARSVLEISRGVQYRELTGAKILEELETRPGLGDVDPGAAGHQVESRNFVYTVTPEACSMDDAKDGLGDHNEPALAFCPESTATGSDDRNPDDYRRVSVTLSWTPRPGQSDNLTQRALVTNPVGGLGPSVTSLQPDTPDTPTITQDSVESPSYDILTSGAADTVSWSVDGARLGEATGSGTSWGFNWDLGTVDAPKFIDCTYVLQAEAFDEKGRAGTPNALTVTLNRRAPFPPANFAGGRNLNGAFVDVQWDHNPECDVTKYRVYRGTDTASVDTLVCERIKSEPTECVDEGAPSDETLYYQVVAVDNWPTGGDREGDRSDYLPVGSEEDNTPPTAPTGLSACLGGGMGPCEDIDGNAAPDGTAVLSWPEATDSDGTIAFYRVYRRAGAAEAEELPTYADRLDILFKVPGKPLVFVDSTATGTQSYWVTAVDDLFGESEAVGPVVWQ